MNDPIAQAMDWLIDHERHAWLARAAEQIRQWKREDAENGEAWGDEPADDTVQPREAGCANNAPARIHGN